MAFLKKASNEDDFQGNINQIIKAYSELYENYVSVLKRTYFCRTYSTMCDSPPRKRTTLMEGNRTEPKPKSKYLGC
ncbi:hypothetical protein JTB14_025128 [Gonioctena quinquepunctata]|nr:hypothetical protein JTB14_025128 [Gonioctena quinquepunctata]